MSSFSDEDDVEFLSMIELDKITDLERKHQAEEEAKNKEKNKLGVGVQGGQVWNKGRELKISDSRPEIEEIPFPQHLPSSSRAQPPSLSSRGVAVKSQVQPLEKPGRGNLWEDGKWVESVEDDETWKQFVSWFQEQRKFGVPWFKAIPITALNMSQSLTIISALGKNGKDLYHLVDFAQLIFSFLTTVYRELETFDGDTKLRWNDYKGSIMKLLEAVMLRFIISVNVAPYQLSQQDANKLEKLLEDISQVYITKKMDFQTSSIPETLVQLYPNGFEKIMKTCIGQGNVELVVPVCEKSPENFLRVLSYFHSEMKLGGTILSEDQDFHTCTQSPPVKVMAQKLVDALKGALDSLGFINILPTRFQPLFSFEAAVMCKNPKLFINNAVVREEIFDFLNTLIIQCDGCSDSEDFTWFVISLSSNTSRILKHDKFRSSIQFKKWPYLWKYIRFNNNSSIISR